ncbi:uncharacterized protein YciI [Devosia subaequoris]|uniref:Uncharacterized protein YciI n=1 Tax=Devosia subaequoris TaxID=395930 RepID=A0A7W6NBM4_9HYPH|nr:uncharacterized protein YciI [Devosia subaequoris]
MFILSLTYTAPLSEVNAHIEPHLAWVAGGYDSGTFLASGRKEPRTGGSFWRWESAASSRLWSRPTPSFSPG